MTSELDKIYQKKITAEAKSPTSFYEYKEAQYSERAYNPICGDRFDLYFDMNLDLLDKICFHGFGCVISKASTSFMIKSIEGKSNKEALDIINGFLGCLKNEEENLKGELEVFNNAENFKGRLDCIELSWKSMKSFLEKM